ncbi:MAG: hypothetical protein ACK4FJ_01115 [Ferrovibrio sp.]|uniref:hypothetical protein n=1 Tax=Ferrovibrio sp. TaxID=1917215 RepID=UPI0039188DE7
MTTSQTSFLSEIQVGDPIPEHKLAYLRQRTKNRFYEYVLKKFLTAQANGLSQAELARRINKRPDVLNRLLGAPGNWTFETLSDLLVGICAEEVDPASSSLLNRPSRNLNGPHWMELKSAVISGSPKNIAVISFPNDQAK